jgi:hypothetical protein
VFETLNVWEWKERKGRRSSSSDHTYSIIAATIISLIRLIGQGREEEYNEGGTYYTPISQIQRVTLFFACFFLELNLIHLSLLPSFPSNNRKCLSLNKDSILMLRRCGLTSVDHCLLCLMRSCTYPYDLLIMLPFLGATNYLGGLFY